MSNYRKVVWSEGMFLSPQHFQQQDRYVERLVSRRSGSRGPNGWGIEELKLDEELLRLGKISILKARGIFPDGTPFDIPAEDDAPNILEVPSDTLGTTVHLCIPFQRPGTQEVDLDGDGSDALHKRYIATSAKVNNASASGNEEVEVQLGGLNLSLRFDSDDLSGYATIPVVEVVEKLAEKPIKTGDNFVPPLLNCAASSIIHSQLTQLQGMLHQRGESLAQRLNDSGRSGSAEVADYMLLQVINRIEPLCAQLVSSGFLHPEECYRELIQMAGELATFTTTEKRPPEFPAYSHSDPQSCFAVVFGALSFNLSNVLEQTAISMELSERKFGIFVAPLSDHSLLSSAMFVLAAKADVSAEVLRSHFKTQVRIASVEQIRSLIQSSTPGVPISPLGAAPRQIPYHAGFSYFELVKTGQLWENLKNSGGLAVHPGSELPGLQMELWAIRS